MQKKMDWIGICTLVVAVILLGSLVLNVPDRTPEVNIDAPVLTLTSQDIETIATEVSLLIDTTNDDVIAILNEDEDWENAAEEVATAEWKKADYKDIYNAIDDIYGDIDDRDDIDYVREAENTKYSGMDVDDEDATITQYVKVKYEDDSGDTTKVYLTIETEIDESTVEDQEITETL